MQGSDPNRGIDKASYALLNAVVEDEWATYLLAGEAPMEDIMNKPSHGLSERELSGHFFRLWKQGLIECRLDEFEAVVAPDFEATRQQFEHTKDWPPARDHSLVYRLTRSGGELWEHFASPDWDKVLNNGVGSDPNEYTLSASNRALIELSMGPRLHLSSRRSRHREMGDRAALASHLLEDVAGGLRTRFSLR
jgi:hypothetical protein